MTVRIDLWIWSLDPAPQDLDRLSAHLSAEEAARADRFVAQRHRDHFRAGRGRLREILGGYTGTPPADLQLRSEGNGKPCLERGPHFNLSHSNGWAALAVTPAHPLGIDIEVHRPVEKAVAERFFSRSERAALEHLPEDSWARGFFRIWTRKEALIKALAQGLSMPLDSFDVTADAREARVLRLSPDWNAGRPEGWSLSGFELASDFPGAIAVRTGGARPEIRLREGEVPLRHLPGSASP
ncbi:4'-phosphopantetheinyl transferase [Aliiruegeria haliotis]|uniref:4'-phosphopantetheinyl transferase n=1 Tax=Aliiruegeria haliotis TaxID=1280846 RepID=A0A2T0RVK9_9RHOB|nr:4'-phosphopantetheinyl transferase superfamily protein [Aliiruegeria haliotis]PRY25162.1 4'-phosphopantetheinyl transferase [Aliiruegeria haliotis]